MTARTLLVCLGSLALATFAACQGAAPGDPGGSDGGVGTPDGTPPPDADPNAPDADPNAPDAAPPPPGPDAGGVGARWHPSYLSLGTIYEGDSGADAFFTRVKPQFPAGKGLDYGYLYLNGGSQFSEWPHKVSQLVAGAKRNHMVPVFVVYAMNGGADSASAIYDDLQSASYVSQYASALAQACASAAQAAGDTLVGYVLEPDMLGYLQQQYAASHGNDPTLIPAATHAIYSAGALVHGVDPDFPDTLAGFVTAVNHVIRKHGGPNAFLGWQLNLWGAPGGGGKGICHATETLGLQAGRAKIREVASATIDFALRAGIASAGAELLVVDKYGLDGGGAAGTDPQNPADSYWFWNADLWNNYALFVTRLHEVSGLPVVLWQIPVGHINVTTHASPTAYNPSGHFPALDNSIQHYEDSASSWLYGDSFDLSGARLAYFQKNDTGDPGVSVSGTRVTWPAHFAALAGAGVVAVWSGAGVGIATRGVPQPSGTVLDEPTDGYYWITRAAEYYAHPLALP
jgi:hypothetical protein